MKINNYLKMISLLSLIFLISCEKEEPTQNQWHQKEFGKDGDFFYHINGYKDNLLIFAGEEHDFKAGTLKGTLYKSLDAGKTFVKLKSEFDSEIESICVLNDKTIYISVYLDGVYKTTDQGESWKRLYDLSDWNSVNVFFITESLGYMFETGSDQHYYTKNGGLTWEWYSHFQIKPVFNTAIDKAQFPESTTTGYLLGAWDGLVFKTNDGGLTWKKIREQKDQDLTDMFFVSNSLGYLIDGDKIFITKNGGDAWETLNENEGGDKIWAFNNNTCYLLSVNGIKKSTDGGKVFTSMSGLHYSAINNFYFTSENKGIGIGNNGNIYSFENK